MRGAQTQAPQWPPGSSELAELVRAHDWAATPLGPIGAWPPRLRAVVELVLASPTVASLAYGATRVLVYNDAAARLYGERHPGALGQPLGAAFPDTAVTSFYDRVFAGESVHLPAQSMPIGQKGGLCVFDAFLTPVRNDDGLVEGAHMIGVEVGERQRVETAQESGARLRALAEASSEALYTMGPDWTEMRALSSGGRMADPSALSRAWLMDYIPPEEQARVTAAINEAIRSRSVFELEHRVRRPTGGIGWTLSRAVPILGADGEINEWFGSASDITERKQAEAALRESEAHQAFLLTLSDELRPLTTSVDIAEVASVSLGECFGIDRVFYGEVTGDHMKIERDYTRGVPSLAGEQSCEAFGRDFVALYRSGAVIAVSDVESDARLNDEARAMLRARRIAAFVDVVLFKEEECIGLLGVQSAEPRRWTPSEERLFQAVGERVKSAIENARAESALRESEERFRQFSDASTSILWIRDAATLRMEFASPAYDALYGVPGVGRGGDDRLRAWASLIVPDHRKAVFANFGRVRAGERVEQEFRIRRASDGALRWVHNTDFPLRDAAGRVRWIAGIGMDLTAAKDTAERQGVLVAELQHRTRNLIAVVRSLADRTLDNTRSIEAFGRRFGQRLSALSRVQGLLSHLAAGERVTFKQLLWSELAAHGVTSGMTHKVTAEGPADVPLRSATVQTFALALHELATNAVKYGAFAAADGHLTVRWHVAPGTGASQPHLHVEWQESGVAMGEVNAPDGGGGYGRELIERSLPYQLKAKTSYELRSDGVRCTITVPVPWTTGGACRE